MIGRCVHSPPQSPFRWKRDVEGTNTCAIFPLSALVEGNIGVRCEHWNRHDSAKRKSEESERGIWEVAGECDVEVGKTHRENIRKGSGVSQDRRYLKWEETYAFFLEGGGSLAIFLFFGYSIPVYREIYSRLSLRLILEVGVARATREGRSVSESVLRLLM